MTYHPYFVEGADRPGRWLVTCDHAHNTVPGEINDGTLGLAAKDMDRHIAYDIGAKEVSRLLATRLNSPVILSNFSRLVIDPNRGSDDPTLVMKLYDGTLISGNRHADKTEVLRRRALCYDPYHAAYATLANRPGTVLLSIHSFTPQLRGRAKRPWEIGVLSAWDRRLADPVLERLRAEKDLTIGDNEPYVGHLPGDALDQHGLAFNRPNILIEIRNDLIAEESGQNHWADRLAPVLENALLDAQL